MSVAPNLCCDETKNRGTYTRLTVSSNFLLIFCEEVTLPFSVLQASRYQSRRRQWQPAPVLLPGKSHGGRSLVGCSPWGHQESETNEQLHFHFSLSCTGDGNGNPLQYSCLENPRDGGAWWAAISGVAQSDTTKATWQQQISVKAQLAFSNCECKNINFRISKEPQFGHFRLRSLLVQFLQLTRYLQV